MVKKMKFSSTISIKTAISDECASELQQTISDEFLRISDKCFQNKSALYCESINASFGSILRNDVTVVSMTPRRKEDGYNVFAETEYKPSGFFWIFFVIDILLIETIIGFILGMGITLGLYFYNKKIVADEIENALKNIKKQIE